MNSTVKNNLENLFKKNFDLVRSLSIQDILNDLIENNDDAFDIGRGVVTKLYEEEDIAIIESAKRNSQLTEVFESVKAKLVANEKFIESFKKDIITSIKLLKEKVVKENKGFKIQIILLEYDFEPYFYFCGFGEGNYPILEKPKYIDYNHHQQLFNGDAKVDFSNFWKEKIRLERLLDELELSDMLMNSEIYDALNQSYHFKTFLLLHEAFNRISLSVFQGIPIKLPLFIYGNEHDCSEMNVFIYE